jgi:hypothetical protein
MYVYMAFLLESLKSKNEAASNACLGHTSCHILQCLSLQYLKFSKTLLRLLTTQRYVVSKPAFYLPTRNNFTYPSQEARV